MNINMPPEVRVAPAGEFLNSLEEPQRVHTALFREGTGIGAALGAALEAPHDSDDPLRVISSGCSFAEVDTVLSLAHKHTPDTAVEVLGVDSSEEALAAAQAALYMPVPSLDVSMARCQGEGHDFLSSMRQHGIDVMLTATEDSPGMSLRTTGLRSRYNVKWAQADLRQGLPAEHAASLAMCNNVLYYYSAADASKIVLNVAERVAIHGILSLGSNLKFAGMEEWCGRVTEELEPQGLTPITTADPELVAYRRVEQK